MSRHNRGRPVDSGKKNCRCRPICANWSPAANKSPLSTSRPVDQSTVAKKSPLSTSLVDWSTAAIYLPLATGLSPACRPFLACRLGLPWARVASQVLAGSPGGLGVLPKLPVWQLGEHPVRLQDNRLGYGHWSTKKKFHVLVVKTFTCQSL